MNVREKKSHPRGRPLQLRYPNEPHHRRFADDSLAAKKPQASNVIRLEIERVKQGGKRARALAATSAPPISSAGFHTFSHGSEFDPTNFKDLRSPRYSPDRVKVTVHRAVKIPA